MSQNKKEQILSAASKSFARFGYKKTTLEDIGKKVGLDKASIYYYFKNKEEIFTTIVLNEFKQFITKLHQDIEEDMDCEQKILVYFEERFHFFNEKAMILPQITEIEIQRIMASGLEIFMKIEQGEISFVANILKNCIRNGQIKDCDVEKISEFIFALVEGVKKKYVTNEKYPTPSEFENMIKDIQTALKIFMNGLK